MENTVPSSGIVRSNALFRQDSAQSGPNLKLCQKKRRSSTIPSQMKENPRRLPPTLRTLRKLYLSSGNICAFPNCSEQLITREGNYVGRVCHIEAALEGGERFNSSMTNESRRDVSNLLLMCANHHLVTDNVDEYPVSRLRRIKEEHENRFLSPEKAIQQSLVDWTRVDQLTKVKNLRRMNTILNWEITEAQLEESIAELNDYLDILRRVPIDVRRFVMAVAKRVRALQDTSAVRKETFDTRILLSDFLSAHPISDSLMKKMLSLTDVHGLADLADIDTTIGRRDAIRLRHLESGWALWEEIAEFCELTDTPFETFAENLDFSPLDS